MAGKKRIREADGDEDADALAAAKVLLSSPPLFFSLDRARFHHSMHLTRVVVVQLPVQHLRSKEAMHEYVLKKLLHKPYAPSLEEKAQMASSSSSSSSSCPPTQPYTVVHISAMEPHADTVRQSNAKGDVHFSCMVTLTIAHVCHGVLFGRCEVSRYESCFEVIVPCEGEGEEGKAGEHTAEEPANPADAHGATLRITVRCLNDEPVVPGQAVFVVSEPGSIRCLAVRPPRAAPGPFRMIAAADAEAGPLEKREKSTTGGRARARDAALTREGGVTESIPGAVQIVCDSTPAEGQQKETATPAPA